MGDAKVEIKYKASVKDYFLNEIYFPIKVEIKVLKNFIWKIFKYL